MTNDNGETREALEEAAATWIARRDREGWTADDETSLNTWLAESAGHRVAYYRLNAVWDQTARLEGARGSSRNRLFAIAAGVLLLLVGTVIAMRGMAPPIVAQVSETPTMAAPPGPAPAPMPVLEQPRPIMAPVAPRSIGSQPPDPQRYTTAIGEARTVQLSDGSHVTLDTDSQIRVSMNRSSRTVQLDRGQAYFEVAHDRERPFTVDAGRLSVVAVGTEFSVRRVAADVRVVVAEGTVRIEDTLLPAGGIARVEGDAVQVHQGSSTEVERNLSWRKGVLTFRHTSLSDAVAEFNRYGTRPIVIRDAAIAALALGGVFRSGDVVTFAHLLERTFPIDAAVQPDRIELSARRIP